MEVPKPKKNQKPKNAGMDVPYLYMHEVYYAIGHSSGSFGMPSAPILNPAGSGPMRSFGGDPWLCI